MISRRPKTRASTERAPGPKAMIASTIVAAKIMAGFESNNVGLQFGSSENATPIPPSPAIAPASGVRNPMDKRTPVATAADPANHPAIEAPGSRQ